MLNYERNPISPVESGSARFSRTMLALLLITCIVLMAVGLVGMDGDAVAQDQDAALHGTVPTRTPVPTLDKKVYLPILSRSWSPSTDRKIYLPILARAS